MPWRSAPTAPDCAHRRDAPGSSPDQGAVGRSGRPAGHPGQGSDHRPTQTVGLALQPRPSLSARPERVADPSGSELSGLRLPGVRRYRPEHPAAGSEEPASPSPVGPLRAKHPGAHRKRRAPQSGRPSRSLCSGRAAGLLSAGRCTSTCRSRFSVLSPTSPWRPHRPPVRRWRTPCRDCALPTRNDPRPDARRWDPWRATRPGPPACQAHRFH